jgi:hypothetical protein
MWTQGRSFLRGDVLNDVWKFPVEETAGDLIVITVVDENAGKPKS